MTVFEVNDMTVLEMILTDYMTVTIIDESEVTLMKKVMSSMITPSLENSSKKYEMTNGIEMTYEVTHLVMTTNKVKDGDAGADEDIRLVGDKATQNFRCGCLHVCLNDT